MVAEVTVVDGNRLNILEEVRARHSDLNVPDEFCMNRASVFSSMSNLRRSVASTALISLSAASLKPDCRVEERHLTLLLGFSPSTCHDQRVRCADRSFCHPAADAFG